MYRHDSRTTFSDLTNRLASAGLSLLTFCIVGGQTLPPGQPYGTQPYSSAQSHAYGVGGRAPPQQYGYAAGFGPGMGPAGSVNGHGYGNYGAAGHNQLQGAAGRGSNVRAPISNAYPTTVEKPAWNAARR